MVFDYTFLNLDKMLVFFGDCHGDVDGDEVDGADRLVPPISELNVSVGCRDFMLDVNVCSLSSEVFILSGNGGILFGFVISDF